MKVLLASLKLPPMQRWDGLPNVMHAEEIASHSGKILQLYEILALADALSRDNGLHQSIIVIFLL